MPMINTVTWTSLREADFGDVAVLSARCLAADDGLPLAADAPFLRDRWTGPGVTTTAARDGGGRLLAACSARPAAAGDGSVVTGLVDPSARGEGLGSRLLDWGLAEASRRGGPATVETESLTGAAAALFARRGLHQVFAEDVLRIDLAVTAPPEPVWPSGTVVAAWCGEDAPRFHAVYEAAFRERPGFPGWSAQEWIGDLEEDDDFRPRWSLLASVPGLGDAGFVTAAVGWIVQLGVVPAARGGGLGAALIHESLGHMCADGGTEAWLTVNLNNPAGRLYRRLGFRDRGRRARYQP
jgi:mycothiol synthase